MTEIENQKPQCKCTHPSTSHWDEDGKAWAGKPMACVRAGCECQAYVPDPEVR